MDQNLREVPQQNKNSERWSFNVGYFVTKECAHLNTLEKL